MGKVILDEVKKIMLLGLIVFFFYNYFTSSYNFNMTNIVVEKPKAAIGYFSEAISSSIKSVITKQKAVNAPTPTPSTSSATDKEEFNHAIPFILRHEGGLENIKADRGGITNYGISYAYLHTLLAHKPQLLSQFSLSNRSQIKPSIIKGMSKQEAVKIYFDQWWEKYHYGSIKQQSIASKVFDFSVNMGPKPAVKLLQTACQEEAGYHCVAVNGRLDNATINYINNLNFPQTKQLLYVYDGAVAHHYQNIASKHPADKKFLSGWLRRANDSTGL